MRFIENQKGHHPVPFETESITGLERCDGSCLVCIRFNKHIKPAEGEGCLVSFERFSNFGSLGLSGVEQVFATETAENLRKTL